MSMDPDADLVGARARRGLLKKGFVFSPQVEVRTMDGWIELLWTQDLILTLTYDMYLCTTL